MTISVIIPTYNGAEKLPTILGAMLQQSIMPMEIIVVVDGSTDETANVLSEWKKKDNRIDIVFQENRGRAAVRNKGASVAQGDLLVFFDDDMNPVNDCLESHLQHHEQVPNSILTGAQIDIDTADRSEIQKYKAALSRKWTQPLLLNQGASLSKESLFVTAANCSTLKSVFASLGGFDESLTDAEDFDLAVRAFREGIPLYFNYKAFAWHNDQVNGISYLKRLRQYREAHQRLLALKPYLYADIPQLGSRLPEGIKGKVYTFFAKKYWINWLDQKDWKYLLPRKLRYRLYDIIYTANSIYFPERVNL